MHKALKKCVLVHNKVDGTLKSLLWQKLYSTFSNFFFCDFEQAVQNYVFSFNFNFSRVSSISIYPFDYPSFLPFSIHPIFFIIALSFLIYQELFNFLSTPIFRLSHFLLLSTPSFLFHFPLSTSF